MLTKQSVRMVFGLLFDKLMRNVVVILLNLIVLAIRIEKC